MIEGSGSGPIMGEPITSTLPDRRRSAAEFQRGLSRILPGHDRHPDQQGRDDPDAASRRRVSPTGRLPGRLRPRAVLAELARAANAGRPAEELLARGLLLFLGVTRLPAGVACLCTAGDEVPTVVDTRGFRPATARAVEREFPLAVPDDLLVAELPLLPVPPTTREWLGAAGFTHGVVVPLRTERGPAGVLVGLGRGRGTVRAPGQFLRTMARELGSAIGSTLVRQGLQTANADLLRLLTLVKILGEPRSLEDTLTTVAQAARSFARAVTVDVWLADAARRRLQRIVALEPPGPWRFQRARVLAWGQDLVGWVAETARPGALRAALADPRLQDLDWARERRIASLYGFPLRFMDRLVGVLSLGTAKPLSSAHLSLVEAYSDHAALAIGQADLRRQLET
jgi:GAF domain-containing protein